MALAAYPYLVHRALDQHGNGEDNLVLNAGGGSRGEQSRGPANRSENFEPGRVLKRNPRGACRRLANA